MYVWPPFQCLLYSNKNSMERWPIVMPGKTQLFFYSQIFKDPLNSQWKRDWRATFYLVKASSHAKLSIHVLFLPSFYCAIPRLTQGKVLCLLSMENICIFSMKSRICEETSLFFYWSVFFPCPLLKLLTTNSLPDMEDLDKRLSHVCMSTAILAEWNHKHKNHQIMTASFEVLMPNTTILNGFSFYFNQTVTMPCEMGVVCPLI